MNNNRIRMLDFFIKWIPIIISVIALIGVFYKDFFKGSELKSVLSTIALMKVGENNRAVIVEQIIYNDLLSSNPTAQAKKFIYESSKLAEAIRHNDINEVRLRMSEYAEQADRSGQKLIYDVTPNSLRPFYGDKNITFSFYVPLNITNVGRKTGDITSLVLQIVSKDMTDKKWVFGCFTEIKAEEFVKVEPNRKLASVIGKLFSGISIAPSNNYRIDAHFIPIDVVKNRIVSTSSITPGKYSAQIFGFNSRNDKCLVTNVSVFDIPEKTLVDVFNGSFIVIDLGFENHAESIL